MAVGIKHRIDAADPLSNRLFTKVRRRVNQYYLTCIFNENRRPGAAVVRISGVADSARAADGWHAHGRTAAQHGQGCLHRVLLPAVAPGGCGGRANALVTST